jgi:hypothetical protein
MDDLDGLRALVADHQTVLYGEWKNGRRTPGIVEYIAEAKAASVLAAENASRAATDARANRDKSDRNRTLLLGTLVTALTGVGLKVFELVAAAHGSHH